jgi:hypothetical protein
MAVTGHIFPQFIQSLAAGHVNLSADTFKIGLSNVTGPITLATSGVSTATTWSQWKTNVAAEITGTGYAAGGVAVASPTWAAGGANNSVSTLASSTNPSWTSATITANQAVLYDSTTGYLVAFWDFGGAVSVTASTLTLAINAAGLATVTTS